MAVAPSFGAEAPCSSKEYSDGDVAVTFSCDPDNAQRLIKMALSEVQRLQVQPHPPCMQTLEAAINALESVLPWKMSNACDTPHNLSPPRPILPVVCHCPHFFTVKTSPLLVKHV